MRRGAHDAVRNKTAPLTGWSVVQGTGYVLGVGLLSAVSKDMLHQQYLLNHSKDHNNVQTWNNLKHMRLQRQWWINEQETPSSSSDLSGEALQPLRWTHTEWHTPSDTHRAEEADLRQQQSVNRDIPFVSHQKLNFWEVSWYQCTAGRHYWLDCDWHIWEVAHSRASGRSLTWPSLTLPHRHPLMHNQPRESFLDLRPQR